MLSIDAKTAPKRMLNVGRGLTSAEPVQEYDTKIKKQYKLTPLMNEIMEYTKFIL